MLLSPQTEEFFESYSEAILITDSNDMPVYANPAFTSLTGLQLADVSTPVKQEFFKVKFGYDSDNTGAMTHWESSLTGKNDEDVWVRASVSPYRNQGREEGSVYTLMSNPKLDRMKSLIDSENKLTTLAEATPVMIWMTNSENLTFYFNKSWLDFTGKPLEEQLGTAWFKNVHPEDWKVFNDLNKQFKHNEPYTCVYRLLRYDGVYRYILEIASPRLAPDGSFAGYMGSCLDISEMKEAQIELAEKAKELVRSNEELEQFAYVASHDLQEPLRMIGSYVQLVGKRIEAGKTDGLEEYMKFAVDGVARMQGLISDLLQFSRVNRKGNPFAPVDMNELMKIVSAHLIKRIEETGAELTFDDNMPTINGDSFQLIRLFQNLVENALKFKAPDRSPKVHVSVQEKEQEWQFSIADNGIGIDNKFYTRIFVIFQRLHAREEYEGTGLGLAICKKIVERHGGEIWVESEEGKGSTFHLTIKK